MPNDSEFDQAMFEDNSTVQLGGYGDQELFAGFDDEEQASVSDANAEDTTDAETAENAETQDSVPEGAEESANGAPEDQEEAPTTEQPSAPEKLTFKAKIDHKEQEISIGADELPTIYQKAANMDRAVQRADAARQDADRYRGVVDNVASMARMLNYSGDTPEAAIEAMISGITQSQRESRIQELVSGGTAQAVAEFVVDQQMQSAVQNSAEQAPNDDANDVPDGTIAEEAGGDAPSQEQFAKDLRALLDRRPELVGKTDKFPEEVLQAYISGENLTVAYLDYEAKQAAAEKKALEKANRVLQHNQESARRAPVKGVASSGGTGGKDDPWLAGFDETYW